MKWPSRRPFLLKADIVIYYTGIEQTKVKNHTVHWGHLPPPPSKTSLPLSCQAPLKSAKCPSPTFLGNPPPLYWFFHEPPPLKFDFSLNPQNIQVLHP